MKTFAVAYMSYNENNIIIEIIEAETWQDAVKAHSKVADWYDEESAGLFADDLEDTKQNFFDADLAIDVKEIS